MHRIVQAALLIVSCVSTVNHPRAQELERIAAGEAQAIEEIRARALLELKTRYPETGQLSPVRRDAHAKAHGCVKATFEVDAAVAEELRVGTFAQPARRFKALIRFSNGAFEPGPDTSFDGRGMAIKLFAAAAVENPARPQNSSHDILMINYPAFFSPDVSDYRDLARAGALTGDSRGLRRYFIPTYNPFDWRIRQGYVAYKIASQKITSPLAATYYSMTPFRFGANRAVKYSARPCTGSEQSDAAALPGGGADFLKQALRTGLSSQPACFELLVQERKGDMDTENALVEWSETISPYRRVGRIDIPAQEMNSPEREKSCESLVFNPWNAPAEQQPVGGINRLRKPVYDTISAYRTTRNKTASIDPAALWDKF
jgi:catalase